MRFAAIAVLFCSLFAACSPQEEVELVSVRVSEVKPVSLKELDFVVNAQISNKTIPFKITGISATLNRGGSAILSAEGEDFKVRSGIHIANIPVKASLSSSCNLFDLMRTFQVQDLSAYTVSASATIKVAGCFGKEIEYKDVPIDKLAVELK